MSDELVSIFHGEGVDDGGTKDLHLTLSAVRKFPAKVEEFDLARSDYNLSSLIGSDFAVSEGTLAMLDRDPLSQHGPGLAEFERDLVSLHLHAPAYSDECGHHYEAVWRTTASMQCFRPLLDLAWQLHHEHARPGDHRALDQGH